MNLFRKHFLLILLLPLSLLAVGASFYRFIAVGDYIVTYEGECDPDTQQCFVGYDEESSENYYFTKMQKFAPDLVAQCGADIVECAEASECLPEDTSCSITFCTPETAGVDDQCLGMAETNMEMETEELDKEDYLYRIL